MGPMWSATAAACADTRQDASLGSCSLCALTPVLLCCHRNWDLIDQPVFILCVCCTDILSFYILLHEFYLLQRQGSVFFGWVVVIQLAEGQGQVIVSVVPMRAYGRKSKLHWTSLPNECNAILSMPRATTQMVVREDMIQKLLRTSCIIKLTMELEIRLSNSSLAASKPAASVKSLSCCGCVSYKNKK